MIAKFLVHATYLMLQVVVATTLAGGRDHEAKECIPIRLRPPTVVDDLTTIQTTVYSSGTLEEPYYWQHTTVGKDSFVHLREGTKHWLLMESNETYTVEFGVTNDYTTVSQKEVITFANRTLIHARLSSTTTNFMPLSRAFTAVAWCPDHGVFEISELRYLRIKKMLGLP